MIKFHMYIPYVYRCIDTIDHDCLCLVLSSPRGQWQTPKVATHICHLVHHGAKINLCLPWHEGSCDAAQSLSLQADQQEDRRDSEDDEETWSGLPEEVVEGDVGHGGVKVVVNWMPLFVVIDSASRERIILLWSC